MKTKLLLSTILIAAFGMIAKASHDNSILNIRMFNGQPLIVTIDGIRESGFSNAYQIDHLAPGYHNVKIMTVQRHHFGFFPVTRMVYQGDIRIAPNSQTFAIINRYNHLVIEDVVALRPAIPAPVAPALPGHPGYAPMPTTCSTAIDYGHHDGYGQGHGHYQPYMNQTDLMQLLGVISSKSFESTRSSIARQALRNNYFTSDQIVQLLDVFTFESTRVEIAELAYESVVDPQNYYIVFDAFTFESSIYQLQAHMGN